jgi:DNA-binding NarL/FixJ family response regulator
VCVSTGIGLPLETSEQPDDAVLVVEDHAPFARLVGQHLRPAFRPILTGTVTEAMEIIRREALCAAVVDLTLPDGHGLEVIRTLREHQGDVPVMVLTADGYGAPVNELHLLGAALVVKGRGWEENLRVFLAGLNGPDDEALRRLADESLLSPREREVLGLLAGSATREEVAASLDISIWTVRAHVRSVLRKTGMARIDEVLREMRRRTPPRGD